jgi:hypothetical protein
VKHNVNAPDVPLLPIERQHPSRAPSVHSDASTPLRQAAISGTLVGSSLTLIVMLLMLRAEGGIFGDGGWFLLALWAGSTLIVTTVLWFFQLAAAQRTIWTVERVTGLDLDGDGERGDPLRWLPIHREGEVSRRASDPAAETWQAFEQFVEMAYRNGRTDLRTARNAGYADAQWRLFMDALEAAGLVERTRSGQNAPRRLKAPTAHACIATMRKRGTFVGGEGWRSVPSVSSSVSSSSSSR